MLSRHANFCLSLLKDTNPHIRLNAACLLGQLRESACLLRLKVRLQHEPDASVKEAIRQAITKLESLTEPHIPQTGHTLQALLPR